MKILLIAGHGGSDPGACALGRRECDLTREIVPMIRQSLSRYDCKTDVYDMKKSAIHELIIGNKINFKPYDYVLEVHFNAYKVDVGDGYTKGTEIYVTPTEKVVDVEKAIICNIVKIGLKNRGVRNDRILKVIQTAKNQGVSSALLEVCFMDDADDISIC